MLDLVVFTQYPRTYGPKRFQEEAVKLGLTCKIKSYKYTDLKDLPGSKFVILREPTAYKKIYDLRDAALNFYISKNSKILNQKSYLKWSVLDKKVQANEFEKGGVPSIKALNSYTNEFPFIVKSKSGSHGDHVFKIEKKGELDAVYKKGYKKEDLLFQEFLNSGFDLRVIVLDGKVLGIMKRTPREGEFLSNFSQGGIVSKYEGSDEEIIKDIAINAARHFLLDYVGVDLMMGNDGKWRVLEVNRACQFKGFEQATDVNVASEVVQFIAG